MEEASDLGATAIGVFLLADDYLKAARAASSVRLQSTGPVRLPCLHACELFLKAYLRASGKTHSDMRKLGHDLAAHAQLAVENGLALDARRQRDLKTVTKIKAYVGSRYQAGSSSEAFSSVGDALGLAEAIRETVRLALRLDDLGMPLPA